MATQTAWRIPGDVMEACSCATTCPCNFGSDPIPLPCEVVIGWRIADGQHPVGHMAKISDIVDAILYFEGACFVTGEILHVDSGQSAGH